MGIDTDLPTKLPDVKWTFRAPGLDTGTSQSSFSNLLPAASADRAAAIITKIFFTAGSKAENSPVYHTASIAGIISTALVS
ncbi:hypothetical protein SD427_02210 [Chryseobacterium sp. JJR-5R]|uniref:hypothetical protein n=1 Tax=Chryseobacterium sp. JJR-5R TaxID=3093923 RepID=UPI002A74C858|nr:hypothetical protein [Chryseobacterium sp. JJR-5R]WPO83178.1 hypothetical protein SD427_02210 [Chryseobacterium sp. JJR-5R]